MQESNGPLKGNSIGDLVWYKGSFQLMNYAQGSLIFEHHFMLPSQRGSASHVTGQGRANVTALRDPRPSPALGCCLSQPLPCPESPSPSPRALGANINQKAQD